VLVREAGGYISDTSGHDGFMVTGNVVAGNEQMQKELMKLLKKAEAA
jgi:myo-inositol-1(or 4)-monophosphatase